MMVLLTVNSFHIVRPEDRGRELPVPNAIAMEWCGRCLDVRVGGVGRWKICGGEKRAPFNNASNMCCGTIRISWVPLTIKSTFPINYDYNLCSLHM